MSILKIFTSISHSGLSKKKNFIYQTICRSLIFTSIVVSSFTSLIIQFSIFSHLSTFHQGQFNFHAQNHLFFMHRRILLSLLIIQSVAFIIFKFIIKLKVYLTIAIASISINAHLGSDFTSTRVLAGLSTK